MPPPCRRSGDRVTPRPGSQRCQSRGKGAAGAVGNAHREAHRRTWIHFKTLAAGTIPAAPLAPQPLVKK